MYVVEVRLTSLFFECTSVLRSFGSWTLLRLVKLAKEAVRNKKHYHAVTVVHSRYHRIATLVKWLSHATLYTTSTESETNITTTTTLRTPSVTPTLSTTLKFAKLHMTTDQKCTLRFCFINGFSLFGFFILMSYIRPSRLLSVFEHS